MPQPTLLADLALLLAKSPEDVATEAFTLILGRSEVARHALNGLFEQWIGSREISVVRWKSQVVGADDSRTDMEGEDSVGRLCAILENKFWAGLTPNQPAAYLRRLDQPPGLLAFVAPSTRLSILTSELAIRAKDEGLGVLEFQPVGVSQVAAVNGQTLVVSSWEVVLAVIEGALESARDHSALADVRQLMGLAERMDQTGFLPLSSTDLTGPNATRILQFCQIVDQAMSLVLTKSFANKDRLKATAGAGWYGHYFRMYGYGCQLSFNAPHWARYGHSPVWLRVADGLFMYPEGLYAPIASTLPSASWLCEERDSYAGLWLPIRLAEGRDRDIVVEGMVAQIHRIADVLATRPIQLAADVSQSVVPELTGAIVSDT